MTFNEYQNWATNTNIINNMDLFWGDPTGRVMYAASGLCKESGEFLQLAHRAYFIPGKALSHQEAVVELGDVLWNLAQAAAAIGYSLEAVALLNCHKREQEKKE